MKKFLNRLFVVRTATSPLRKEYSKLIWCSDCGSMERIWFPKMDVTTTIREWLFDYRLPQGWLMVRVGLRLHFLCPVCKEKRRAFGERLLGKEKAE